MKFSFSTLAISLSLLFLNGCVSASKHKEEVSSLQSQIEQDKSSLSASQAENEKNKAEIEKLEKILASLTKDRGQLQSSLDEMKKAMEEMRQRQLEQKKRLEEFKDLTQRFKKLTDSGTLSVKIVDGKMVVSLGADILFPSGSAKLSTPGINAIREVAKQLISIPGKRYQIEGHTDNVPISTTVFPSNWELASARALTVVRAMIDSGMPDQRVSAASFGDTQPINNNDTAENKTLNRRIAIVVVPNLSSLPGYEELNKLGYD